MKKKQGVKQSRGPVFTPYIGDIVIFQPKKKYITVQTLPHICHQKWGINSSESQERGKIKDNSDKQLS